MQPSHKRGQTGAELRRILLTVVPATLFAITAGPALAGIQNKDLPATGKPEQTLSAIRVGIHATGMSIDEVIKLYGPPTSREDAVVPDGAGGTRFYKWEWPGLRMSVATFFYYLDAQHTISESKVDYIDVWGDAPRGAIGTTGRGLQLGSTLEQQKALYGDRYSIPYTAKDGTKYVLVEWEDGTELTIDYELNGHCNHIRLAGGNQ